MREQFRPIMAAARQVQYRAGRIVHGEQYVERTFTKYYNTNRWRGEVSVSGSGSSLEQTTAVREQLPILIKGYGVKSMLDIPCGDYLWMKEVPLGLDQYIGADIVGSMVDENNKRYAESGKSFLKLDAINDNLPEVDLIFTRDCLVHFSKTDVLRALRNFKRSGAMYLLTTTFTDRERNKRIETGGWRPLNLEIPPFNLPSPLTYIDEHCTEAKGKWSDKNLALWRLSDIQV